MYTVFETLFLSNKMRQKYNYVVFYSLNFHKPIHTCSKCLPSATVHCRIERHTVWIVANGISLISQFHFWARKIQWTLDFSIPISQEHCLNDFFGDRAKTCMTASAHSSSVELLFLPHRPFNTSCTVPSTSNLSRILVIATIVGGVPNSTLQLRWVSTTFSTFQ